MAKYTDTEKQDAVARVLDGETPKDVAASIGASKTTVENWVKAEKSRTDKPQPQPEKQKSAPSGPQPFVRRKINAWQRRP